MFREHLNRMRTVAEDSAVAAADLPPGEPAMLPWRLSDRIGARRPGLASYYYNRVPKTPGS